MKSFHPIESFLCTLRRLSFLCRARSSTGTTTGLPMIDIPGGLEAITLGLLLTLVLLLDLERLKKSLSDIDDDVEEARRWRCICVGSTFGILAERAKRDKISTTDTMPVRLVWKEDIKVGEAGPDSFVTNTRWALVASSFSIVYDNRLDGKTE